MAQDFNSLLVVLNAHRRLETDDDWTHWLNAVEHLPIAPSELGIAKLFQLLHDDFDAQHGMWALLHKIEDNESTNFLRGFIRAVPHLQQSAPHWANICAMRILQNTQDCVVLRTLITELPQTDDAVPIRGLLTHIAQTEPAFAENIAFVLS